MNIVIIPKITKYDFDRVRFRFTKEELLDFYRQDGEDIDRIVGGHERHMASLQACGEIFSGATFLERNELTRKLVRNADLVISLGGDDHFKYVSHFLENEVIAGINSDTFSSEGNLCYFTDAADVLAAIKGKFTVENWTRLQASVNGEKVQKATGDYSLGEYVEQFMSSYAIEYRGDKEEQKSSGVMVMTGAGSSGWGGDEARYLHPEGIAFPRTARIARFIVKTPHHGKYSGLTMLEGVIEAGEELIVHSLNKRQGIVAVDSLENYEFNRPRTAVIKISETPLRVLAGG